MSQAAEQIARQFANANINKREYGNAFFWVTVYGAKGDGVNDDTASIQAAVNAAADAGGGMVYLPHGRYRITSTITIGNGTLTKESTIHGIKLVGVGSGVGGEVNGIYKGNSVLVWDGASGGVMVKLAGPILRCGVEGLLLDGNGLAGTGLYCNHVAYSYFQDIFVKRWKGTAIVHTVDTTAAIAYGAASNVWIQIATGEPSSTTACGMLLDGYDPTSLDVCRNVFIGMDLLYGGSTGSYGIKVRFTDNNSLYQIFTYKAGAGHDGGGKGILFQQAVNPAFPQNNVFYQAAPDSIGGSSGTNMNMFFPLSDDGQGYTGMLIDNVIYYTYDGRIFEGTVPRSTLRQVQNAYSTTSSTTSSTTNATLPGTLFNVKTKTSKIRVSFNAYCGKATGGSGKLFLNFDNLLYNATTCEVAATGYNNRTGFDIILDVGPAIHPIKVDYVSTDTNPFTVFNWSMIIEEID